MFAGQGKLMVFGLLLGITFIIGLGFIAVAAETPDPTRGLLIGVSIIGIGCGGMVGYYFYTYLYEYTRYKAIGMLLRPGGGAPSAETWVLNEDTIPLTLPEESKSDDTKKDKDKTEPKPPEGDQKEKIIDPAKVEALIPEKTKGAVKADGKTFHYYLIPHTGDTKARELLATIETLTGSFEYYPEEVMINDLPRRIHSMAFGTGDLIGRHDIYLPALPKKGLSKIIDVLRRKEEKPYESVNVYLLIDSNYHGKEAKLSLGLKTPTKDNVEKAMTLIKTIDSSDYIDKLKMAEQRIKDLQNWLYQKLTWAIKYNPKIVSEEDEERIRQLMGGSPRGSFWNRRNIFYLLLIGGMTISLLYLILYQGAFQIEPEVVKPPPGGS